MHVAGVRPKYACSYSGGELLFLLSLAEVHIRIGNKQKNKGRKKNETTTLFMLRSSRNVYSVSRPTWSQIFCCGIVHPKFRLVCESPTAWLDLKPITICAVASFLQRGGWSINDLTQYPPIIHLRSSQYQTKNGGRRHEHNSASHRVGDRQLGVGSAAKSQYIHIRLDAIALNFLLALFETWKVGSLVDCPSCTGACRI